VLFTFTRVLHDSPYEQINVLYMLVGLRQKKNFLKKPDIVGFFSGKFERQWEVTKELVGPSFQH
jgi:hypothetical protein